MNPSTMTPNTPESDSAAPPLLLSSLGIRLNPVSKNSFNAIVLKGAGFDLRQIPLAVGPGGHHHEEFNPPLEASCHEEITICIQKKYRGVFKGEVFISLDPKDIIKEAREKDGEQVYTTTKLKNVEIKIGIKSLPSMVKEVIASCSKFRLLIIGESGVGKSSLINKVFGVTSVKVFNDTRGEATIDQEYTAQENHRFIIHDSRGFEAADQLNLTLVREFISRRRSMPHLRDQLHAVWLCLTIPCAGGRLLEAGVEEFLNNRKEILGDIPLVVVLTKFDLLVNTKRVEAINARELLQEDILMQRAQESLEKLCLTPLRTAARSKKVPLLAVSTEKNYEKTLSVLVKETTKNVGVYIKDEAPQYLAAIAQRVNLYCKVQTTIAIGEKRYWSALAASPNFTGHTLESCLNVLHKDIVTTWNFDDPNQCLYEPNFKNNLLATEDLNIRNVGDIQRNTQKNITLLAAIVTIIAGVTAGTGGLALPIIVPIAGAVVLTKLAHDLYRASQNIVRQLMAYIVSLTCVMQTLFMVTSVENGGPVTADLVTLAMGAYTYTHRGDVHKEINAFHVDLAVKPGKRDLVLEKIKEMINKYRITDEQLDKFRHWEH